jgi:3-ketosteroid 9alpha-monooxygenase subunit B
MTGAVPLRVREIVRETAEASSFVLDVSADQRERFMGRAGQYLTVSIPWDDFRVQRCYSLSSAPGVDDYPTITVKRVQGGRVSNWLLDNVEPGAAIACEPPAGEFVSSGDVSRPLVAFAAGSGITPVMSLIKQALYSTNSTVRLFYANRDADSVIFAAALADLERAYPGRLVITRHLDVDSGYPESEQVSALAATAVDADFYLCGPAPFMAAVEAGLRSVSVDPHRVHIERFASPEDPDRATMKATTYEVPRTIAVTLKGMRHHLDYVAGRTVLETCQDNGVEAPRSCEDGYCGTCMAVLKYGDADMGNPKALSDADTARGRVLTCQLRPASGVPFAVTYDEADFRIRENVGRGTDVPLISRYRATLVVALLAVGAMAVRILRAHFG